MDWDEAQKQSTAQYTLGSTLERHSLGELEHLIRQLEAEIVRVRAEIETKRAHEARAASIFKS